MGPIGRLDKSISSAWHSLFTAKGAFADVLNTSATSQFTDSVATWGISDETDDAVPYVLAAETTDCSSPIKADIETVLGDSDSPDVKECSVAIGKLLTVGSGVSTNEGTAEPTMGQYGKKPTMQWMVQPLH